MLLSYMVSWLDNRIKVWIVAYCYITCTFIDRFTEGINDSYFVFINTQFTIKKVKRNSAFVSVLNYLHILHYYYGKCMGLTYVIYDDYISMP